MGNIDRIKTPDGTISMVQDTVSGYQTASDVSSIISSSKISDLTDDTSTNPIDKADTLTGLTATVTELNHMDGVTSNVQTQCDDKLNKQQITNCILEDPQNIKLELSNGTLTLKAGSVVCVPNGFESDGTTPKFDEVTIASDLTTTGSNNTQNLSFYRYDGRIDKMMSSQCFSGSSAPTSFTTSTYALWYDTTSNLVKFTSDSGSTWTSGQSLPFGIITATSTQITSIDQTFQSIGYIGSTVFVRKGLKVLIPNGRNDDGSLKNIEYTTTLVKILIDGGSENHELAVSDLGNLLNPTANVYDEVTNTNSSGTYCIIGKFTRTSGVISNFKPYTAINILKYSDKSQVTGWFPPSSKSVSLTLGASGTSYTAPANGWVNFSKIANAAGQYIQINSGACPFIATSSYGSAFGLELVAPVKGGSSFTINYNASGATQRFKFVYAEGEV